MAADLFSGVPFMILAQGNRRYKVKRAMLLTELRKYLTDLLSYNGKTWYTDLYTNTRIEGIFDVYSIEYKTV